MADVAQRLEAIVVATESDGSRRPAGIHNMLQVLKNEGHITDFVYGQVEGEGHNYEIRVALPDGKRLAAKFDIDLSALTDHVPQRVDTEPQRYVVTASAQFVVDARTADHARQLALDTLHPVAKVVNVETCDLLGPDDHPAVD